MASANVNCRILPGVIADGREGSSVESLADPKIAVAFVDEAHPSKPSPLRPDVMTLSNRSPRKCIPARSSCR